MRWLFVLLITVLIASDITGHNPGLGPGLSVKNALLYVIALALLFRVALSGRFQMRLPTLHIAWAVWIGYALLTWLAAFLVIHYRGYDPIQSAIALKSYLIDAALFFFVVFYGVRDEADFKIVLCALVAAVGISSFFTLTDVVGWTAFGTKVGTSGAEADRVFGAFGHANETGAALVCMLPAVVAVAMSSRGPSRLFWYAGAAATFTVYLLTVSRGAYVALVLGYLWAAFLCRSLLPPSRIASWILVGGTLAILAVGLVSLVEPHVAAAVTQRLFDNPAAMGISEASSGRTGIWQRILEEMMSYPVTLFTGFGWDVYATMPFVYVTHNVYLDQWFNLGLLGVAVYVIILWSSIATARRAASVATEPMNHYMIAFVFGLVALSVAVMFTNLYTSPPYIWMYVGLTMRGAIFVLDNAEQRAKVPARVVPPLGTSWRRA